MRCAWRRALGFVLFYLVTVSAHAREPGGTAAADALDALPAFTTPYYIIHTDLEGDDAREAGIRMTRMAEEYHARTRAFSGAIRKKLDFYLFKNPDDYVSAGGHPGSAGAFTGEVLMAVAGNEIDGDTWHTVQHEGFHQFAHAVIGGELPIWVNEGLAEYFGEGLFTGDGFVTGVIPPWRLERVKERLMNNEFMPIQRMMAMSHLQWNQGLAIENYDQAWTMVHFLAHGEDGAYQKAFNDFMIRIGRGQKWQLAWQETFGDPTQFEARWRKWWSELPDGPTADLYHRASVATLTSFVARAFSQQQRFATFDEFVKTAREGKLKHHREDWLPPRLLNDALLIAQADGAWSLVAEPGKPPTLELVTEEEQQKFIGRFTLGGGRVKKVWVDGPNKP